MPIPGIKNAAAKHNLLVIPCFRSMYFACIGLLYLTAMWMPVYWAHDAFPIPFSCEGLDFYHGMHLVFSGDSLMHYQYLAFVYTLRHCVEVSVKQVPGISEHNWNSWDGMFLGTNSLLHPFETCDCFRSNAGFVSGEIYSNRYYHDPYRNVTVTYMNLGWNGEFCQGREYEKNILNSTTNGVWKYSLPVAIRTHLTRLRSKPHVLLLNAAFFKNNFHKKKYVDEVVKAVKSVPGLRLIWKTTNYSVKDRLSSTLEHTASVNFFKVDRSMCSYAGVGCLNISWSKLLPVYAWAGDGFHFRSFVYNWINRHMRLYLKGDVVDVYGQYEKAVSISKAA